MRLGFRGCVVNVSACCGSARQAVYAGGSDWRKFVVDSVSGERAASLFSLFRLFSLAGMHFVKGKIEIGGLPIGLGRGVVA